MGVRPVGVSIGSLSKFFPQHEIEGILRASGRALSSVFAKRFHLDLGSGIEPQSMKLI